MSDSPSRDPHWWRRAVFYQVYPRSFQDSNGDGIGDLSGLIARLDYLNDGTPRSLGIDGLWLTPIFPSPQHDVGYDIADYCDVDSAYGDLATLDRLVAECHRRDIRVLLDFVPNHTSDLHPWFLESRAGRMSARRDWYIWRDPATGGGPPNNWLSVFGGSAWTFDPPTGQYYLHAFLAEQPDLNWRNPAVVDAMHDVMRFWLRRGIDGFRIDALGRVGKEPGFPDNPPNPEWDGVSEAEQQTWQHNRNHPHVFEVARGLRRVLDEFPGAVGVGETFGDEAELARFYGGPALDGLHLAFNFHFIERREFDAVRWSAPVMSDVVSRALQELPDGALPAFAFANHDRPRFISRHDRDGKGRLRARAAALLLLALPGTPFIYYGEEIGMADVIVPPDRQRDGARFGYHDRDPARTPMQWDASEGRGFSAAEPWLPFGPADVNVAGQEDDASSLLSLYRRCIWTRKGEPSLQDGGWRELAAGDGVFAFVRAAPSSRPVIVAVNTSEAGVVALPAGRWEVIAHTDREHEGDVVTGSVVLGRLAAAWWRPVEDGQGQVELAAGKGH